MALILLDNTIWKYELAKTFITTFAKESVNNIFPVSCMSLWFLKNLGDLSRGHPEAWKWKHDNSTHKYKKKKTKKNG